MIFDGLDEEYSCQVSDFPSTLCEMSQFFCFAPYQKTIVLTNEWGEDWRWVLYVAHYWTSFHFNKICVVVYFVKFWEGVQSRTKCFISGKLFFVSWSIIPLLWNLFTSSAVDSCLFCTCSPVYKSHCLQVELLSSFCNCL